MPEAVVTMPRPQAGTRALIGTPRRPALSRWRRVDRALFAASLLVAAVLLLLPSDKLPQVDLWDKLEHAGTFAVLAVIGVRARLFRRLDRRLSLAFTGIGLVGFGAMCEALQLFVPGRESSIHDVVANTVGVLAGMMTAAMFERWRQRRLT